VKQRVDRRPVEGIERPDVGYWAVFAFTALLFFRVNLHTAVPLAHAAASRNTGLMLAAAAGAVPELVWLYMALLQIPIYVLPLIIKPLLRRLAQQAPI